MNTVKIKTKTRRGRKPSYHHGDLRQQLLNAAEQIILERGVDGFTLREAARRAGVSPAAPAHHFGDARGLLTEVACLGFAEFGEALARADESAGSNAGERLRSQARAYVRFALAQPARFQLMFREDQLDTESAELRRMSRRSYEVLEGAVRAAMHISPTAPLEGDAYGLLLAMWSIVHGFSHLALGGKLRDPAGHGDFESILQSVLPLLLRHLPPV